MPMLSELPSDSTKRDAVGTAAQFEENQPIAPHAMPPPRPSSTEQMEDAAKPDALPTNDVGTSNADLVPWIKLK